MTPARRDQVETHLRSIAAAFTPSEDEPELTMWGLISRYNRQYDNPELIGGVWVRQHLPELANLP